MGEVREMKVEERPKMVYDSSKNYSWEPTDTITMTGAQFAVLLNVLRRNTYVAAAPLQQMLECTSVVEDILKESVEKGLMKEVEATSTGDVAEVTADASIEGLPKPADL